MATRFSHPGTAAEDAVLLTDHLEETATRVTDVLPPTATIQEDVPLIDVVQTIAHVHDIGKATTWFQQHIGVIDGDPDGPTAHSPLGAFAAYYALDRSGYSQLVSLAGLVAIASHHGSLPDVADSVFKRASPGDSRSADYARRQALLDTAENIDQKAADVGDDAIRKATDGAGSWSDFYAALTGGDLFRLVSSQVSRRGLRPSTTKLPDDFYDGLLQIWSGLCLVDKSAASGTPRSAMEYTTPSRERLDAYINQLGDDSNELSAQATTLNGHRNTAREGILRNASEFAQTSDNLATLTLPTGLGKTLSGLDAAFTIRDETDRERIVYALPFTSIVDQIADEIRTIYDTDETGDLLTIHHHLAETITEVDATDANAYVEQLLGESWQNGLTVSTYVQLFESLAGPRNSQSLKLPSLYDSVIILDEPQSLPHAWWPLIRRLVQLLTDEYEAIVIAMTATQPRLFRAGNQEAVELVEQPTRYFEEIQRVEYTIDPSVESVVTEEVDPLEYEQATDRLVDVAQQGESLLCICNTIDSARRMTECVREALPVISLGQVYAKMLEAEDLSDVQELVDVVVEESDGPILVHLSTRLRPRDRLRFIQTTKRLLDSNVQLVVVSTQLVEAGVDISFENVFRDIAPIDSVVQAAGRCNRSFEQDKGNVTVWQLAAPEGKSLPPSEAVYNRFGESLLNVTWKSFQEVGIEAGQRCSEQTVAWDAVTEYYRILREERNVGNEGFVDLLEESKAATLGELSLIDTPQQIDVLVSRTAAELRTVETIREAWNTSNFDRVDTLLDELQDCRISIPIYDTGSHEAAALHELPPLHAASEVRHLDATNQHAHFFDDLLGFEHSSGVDHRFL